MSTIKQFTYHYTKNDISTKLYKGLKAIFFLGNQEFESFYSLICFYVLVSWLCHLILEIYFISDFIKRFTNNTHEQVVKT